VALVSTGSNDLIAVGVVVVPLTGIQFVVGSLQLGDRETPLFDHVSHAKVSIKITTMCRIRRQTQPGIATHIGVNTTTEPPIIHVGVVTEYYLTILVRIAFLNHIVSNGIVVAQFAPTPATGMHLPIGAFIFETSGYRYSVCMSETAYK
jgi:hypothetical protein